MAKRETPEFNPTRIVQPVASPVETFVQPVLQQPAPTQGMEIAQALSGLSSSLSGLGEDLLLARKQQDIAAGEAEDLSQFTPKQLREYEEKAGGMLPWRYQAALNSYGMRQTEQNYQGQLFARLPELADPINLDGTPKTEAQVFQEMNKIWDETMGGVTGYYARAGAAQARQSIDAQFRNMWSQQRRQNVVRNNESALMGSYIKAFEEGATGFDSVEMINALHYSVRNIGFSATRDIGIKALDVYLNSELKYADSGTDFDRFRAVIRTLQDNGIDNSPLNEMQVLALDDMLKNVDLVESEVFGRDAQKINQQVTQFGAGATSIAITELVTAKANSGFVYRSDSELVALAERSLRQAGTPEHLMERALGTVVGTLKGSLDSINREAAPDPRVFESLYTMALSGSTEAPAAFLHSLQSGAIRPEQFEALQRTYGNSVDVTGKLGKDFVSNIVDAGFDGLTWIADSYPDDIAAQLESSKASFISDSIIEAREALIPVLQITDPIKRESEARKVVREVVARRTKEWRDTYSEALENENLRTAGYDFLGTKKADIDAAVNIEFPSKEGGFEPESALHRNRAELQSRISERIFQELRGATGTKTERLRFLENQYRFLVADEIERFRTEREAATEPAAAAEGAEIPPPTPEMQLGGPMFQQYVAATSMFEASPTPDNANLVGQTRRAMLDSAFATQDRYRSETGPGASFVRRGGPLPEQKYVPTKYGFKNTEWVFREAIAGEGFYRGMSYEQLLQASMASPSKAIDAEATKEYLQAMAITGGIDVVSLETGFTTDGMSLAHAFRMGWLHPLNSPLMSNKDDIARAIKSYERDGTGALRFLLDHSPIGTTPQEVVDAQVANLILTGRANRRDFEQPQGTN